MNDYAGVTHVGLAVVANDTGKVIVVRRADDPTDAEDVRGTWEFPGGAIEPGEDPQAAAFREFEEELGFTVPPGEVTHGWRSGNGIYQGFVYRIPAEYTPPNWQPTEEVSCAMWLDPSDTQLMGLLPWRPEMRDFDWNLVSGNEDAMTETLATQVGTAEDYLRTDAQGNPVAQVSTEPTAADDWAAITVNPIPLHGVVAPEEVTTGDKRGFAAGSMTSRMGRLPFRHAPADIGAHDGAVPVGSVDRMMRNNGLIHWEGQTMPSDAAERLVELMAFFDGRYGVSVDGDQGSLDSERVKATGVAWFDAVRASGLTAVDIPAFQEAYVAFGPHPEMPAAEEQDAMVASGNLVTFGRGPGWAKAPVATNRIHRYWTEKGQPGYNKVAWGTPGDFARAKALIGAEIAKHSPDKMRFLNQIIAQWHHDALGYWPATHAKMLRGGTKAGAEAETFAPKKKIEDTPASDDIDSVPEDNEFAPDEWQMVLTSSGKRVLPPASYFTRHPDTDATTIEEPDANGIRRVHGYAAEWGVCHIGHGGCVEPPVTGSDEYPDFHLGRTKTTEGYIKTGLITYGVQHRGAEQILSEAPTQAHFDDLSHAWAAVRLGEDERGIWFSGVVLPTVEEKWLTAIEASGQVSGEWLRGELRTLLTVNVPGFPVMRASAVVEDGEVLALVASAHSPITDAPCAGPTPAERMAALRQVWAEEKAAARLAALREKRGA